MPKQERLLCVLLMGLCTIALPGCERSTSPKVGASADLVSLEGTDWHLSSVPLDVGGAGTAERAYRRGEIWWYSVTGSAAEGDLNPRLPLNLASRSRLVLELQFYPYPHEAADLVTAETWGREESWGGVTQLLSTVGLDLSGADAIFIWVNDFVPWESYEQNPDLRMGSLYVELGGFREDAIWMRRPVDCATLEVLGGPVYPPNAMLDTEDVTGDGILETVFVNEDTGLDGVADEDGDTAFDDFVAVDPRQAYNAYPQLCTVYSGINGTEGNGRLDSEDIDENGILGLREVYFRLRVDLADATLIDTDVRRDYEPKDSGWKLADDNGWRRIKISLDDAVAVNGASASDRTHVQSIRVWLTGCDGPRRFQIAGIDIPSADQP